MIETILSQYVIPVAVIVSAGATTATAAFAYKMYQTVEVHDRALFGEPEVSGHDGIVDAVNQNTEMTDTHRRVLQRHDLLSSNKADERDESGRRWS